MFKFLGYLKFYHTVSKCDHRTKRTGIISAFGERIITQMPLNDTGSVDWCLKCIEKEAIQCAWCTRPIFIGNPITLYSTESDKVPKHATVFDRKPIQLVGCLDLNCADTGGDRAGFWIVGDDGKGKVERVPTAFEVKLHDVVKPSTAAKQKYWQEF